MTTLRELLDDDHTKCCSSAAAYRVLRARIESWAYGEERECLMCGGSGKDRLLRGEPCTTCHGTGKTREPGLPERVREEAAGQAMTTDSVVTPAMVVAALRQELGEVT